MSDAHLVHVTGGARSGLEAQVRMRDWILLPLLSLLTIGVLAGSFRLIARLRLATVDGNCIVLDRWKIQRGVPNSVCSIKAAESPPVEYRFNGCGHRAGMDCGPKALGSYRIVMAGSSYPFGWAVKREESFAALLPLELSRKTLRKIELYNCSLPGEGGTPRTLASHFNELLTAQPGAILWILTPWDIVMAERRASRLGGVKQGQTGTLPIDLLRANLASIRDQWSLSKPGRLIQLLLSQSQSAYVRLYLERGSESGFLKAEPDPEWQYRLNMFRGYAADIEERARTAGVPVIVTLVPNRAQAAMISMGEWPAGYDPYKLGDELRAIVTSHGGTYIDILPDFRALPNPEQYYYPIDNHPDTAGNAIISEMLARELTSGAVPAFKQASQP